MGIRETRLLNELASMEALCQMSSLVEFAAKGDPPDEYMVTFRCVGMIDSDEKWSEHVIYIYLSSDFPREPPMVTFVTPVFHPNVMAPIQSKKTQAAIQRSLESVEDEAAREKLREEIFSDHELFEGRICLDTLDLNWSPSITLDLICVEVGEMIQYKRYNVNDPLNSEAAQWARQNKRRLPVDTRNLCDLKGLEQIRILGETSVQDLEECIRIL